MLENIVMYQYVTTTHVFLEAPAYHLLTQDTFVCAPMANTATFVKMVEIVHNQETQNINRAYCFCRHENNRTILFLNC